jgi:hypothetical protein
LGEQKIRTMDRQTTNELPGNSGRAEQTLNLASMANMTVEKENTIGLHP